MGKSQEVAITQKALEALYEPDYFHNHGMNPAMKTMMRRMQVNTGKRGETKEMRAVVNMESARMIFTRDIDDYLSRNLRVTTLPKYFITGLIALGLYDSLVTYVYRHFPMGTRGITKYSQTTFFKRFGPIPSAAMLSLPILGK